MIAALGQLARTAAAGIADSLVLGLGIAVIVWAILGLLRNHRAATRFVVVAAALATVAMLPVMRTFAHGRGGAASAPLVHLGESLANWIAVLWAIGAGIGMLRLAIGISGLRRIRRGASPLALSPEMQNVAREICPSRRVELLASDAVPAPCAIGFLRPAVVMPRWTVDELSPSELRHVLIHELSHLRRRDDWTNLLQRIIQALFFFHPAVWWMESRLSLEREMACDDAVLALASSPRDYAECLARLAEKSVLRRGLALAQAAVTRMRQTSRRVARILRIDGATRGSKFAVSLATVFAVSSFGALLQAPELVSFVGTQTAPAVALASNRQFRRHLAGNVTAINASFATRRDAAAPRAVATATKSAPEMHAIVRSVPTEVTHVQPAVHVVRASMTADSPRVVTYVLVLRDENSITVWRISTWQYAPSRQVRPIGKTT